MNSNPQSGFTLLEMTVVIMILLALASIGLFASTKYTQWQTGRTASEDLRNVYSAQRLYLADNPTAVVANITEANIIPYLANGATTLPIVKSLANESLTINVSVTPPVFQKGTNVYDPSGDSRDSLWDVGE
jgi:prepilin-type N-terminal cleavage/methylation domain-containing protein